MGRAAPHSRGPVASRKRDNRDSAPVGAPPTLLRVGREWIETNPGATTRRGNEQHWLFDIVKTATANGSLRAIHRVALRSTQVGFTRLASSNCRSRASPRSVSRGVYPRAAHRADPGARRGHERAKSRRAKRTVGRRLISRCQTAQCCSVPRRVVAPGLVSIPSHPTRRGVGGAPTGALFRLSRLRDATDPRE